MDGPKNYVEQVTISKIQWIPRMMSFFRDLASV